MAKYTKEELYDLIFIKKFSYEKIGRIYGISGAAIKKAARKFCFDLPKKRIINEKETFNKGVKYVSRKCLNCGKELEYTAKKYCSLECKNQYDYIEYIKKWKRGEDTQKKNGCVSSHIRRYFLEKYNNKCQKCGWGAKNQFTNSIPLHIHHIDGDCTNNEENNLELLCPNCHSLTENYGSLNNGKSKRYNLKNYKTNLKNSNDLEKIE